MLKPKKKRPLGRRELIDLPALALRGVEAKVDTGAYTSAIHCDEVRLAPDPATGQPVLHVRLLDPAHLIAVNGAGVSPRIDLGLHA
ncbi:MAG: hypothetical protein EOO56_30085, partial [Hymenobacter sp.]